MIGSHINRGSLLAAVGRAASLCGVFAVLLIAFFLVARPWYSRWGATDDETRRVLPGDEIIPGAVNNSTRAITIDAPVEQAWRWVAQLGQDRGGFYSFDLLENLVGCEMPTDDRLRPDKQSWQLGDKLWMYPPDKGGGIGFATLRAHVPGHVLGFSARAMGAPLTEPETGSWTFVLEPIDDRATRVIVRGRGRGSEGVSLFGVAFNRYIFEPAHFVMERRMLIGIKQLAEGSDRGRVFNHAHVMLWTITFALFLTALVMTLGGIRWRRSLAGFAAAGLVFQALTLTQPSLVLGIVLVTSVAWLLVWPRRTLPPVQTLTKSA